MVRVRPLNRREQALGSATCMAVAESHGGIRLENSADAVEHSFQFDRVFDKETSQEVLFEEVGRPIVDNCIAGYNSCMLAYGQTGSGKTFTMQGDLHKGR